MPRLLGGTPDEAAIEAALPAAQAGIDATARLLGDQPYFAGESLSLADLLAACLLDMLAETPEWGPLTAGHPNLTAWHARLIARPSLRATTWERVAAMAA